MLSFLNKKIDNIQKTISRGFTLIEMIVVVAIFGILTSIIVFNYGDFNAEIIVTNMAYEVALTTRQAQIFGLGVRGTGGDFDSAYGIYIDKSSGSTQDMIFFGDTISGSNICQDISANDCNCGGSDDECLEKLTMQRNIRIDKLQVHDGSSTCTDIDKIAISYQRPNPEAVILDQENPTNGPHSPGYSAALITVNSPDGRQRHVLIRKSGEISVIGDDQVDAAVSNCSIL